ncbi:hypothetical protein LIER_03802 [Lithospermum erythrorhizon]|uniref:Uncharacterized protein n=1 Tax=Lithospermum erythrorhizon TaxID=34254 RepID=A0AAV3NUL5_LITER
MVRYHDNGKGKVYAPGDARNVLHSCLVTWKPTSFMMTTSLSRHLTVLSLLAFVLSSGSSKRKGSSSSTVENKDPKHARGAQKDTSSSRGSRVASLIHKSLEAATPSLVPDNVMGDQVVEVTSSVTTQEHTEFVDTGGSPECLTIEVAESHPPAPPVLSIAQGAKVSLEDQTSRKQYEVKKTERLEQEVAELETRTRDLRVQIQEQNSVISRLDLETADTSGQNDILEKEIQTEQAIRQGRLLADLDAARLGIVGLL